MSQSKTVSNIEFPSQNDVTIGPSAQIPINSNPINLEAISNPKLLRDSKKNLKYRKLLIICVIIFVIVAILGIATTAIVIVFKLESPVSKTTSRMHQTTTSPNLIELKTTSNKVCNDGYVEPFCTECGLHDFKPNLKIVGGQEAEPHSWPSIVWINFKYKFSVNFINQIYHHDYETNCAGTLLNQDTILTAAHCMVTHALFNYDNKYIEHKIEPNLYFPTHESMYTVYLGMHSKSNFSGSQVLVSKISNFSRHPDYDEYNVLNDIAIIKLKNKIEYNKFIQPSCLPLRSDYPTENEIDAWAAGWGKLAFNGKLPTTLQNVKLTIYDSSSCRFVEPLSKKDWQKQICAGEYNGGKDTCQGDSGGPLYVQDVINGKKKFIIAGITSYGYKCAEARHPGIYTKVSHYLNWIKQSMK